MNYHAIATTTLGYLDTRFRKPFGDVDGDAEINVWAAELSKFNADKLNEKTIKIALDFWADINTNGYPPTVDQFCDCLRKVTYKEQPSIEHKQESKDYCTMWQLANDKQKMFFFVDHSYIHVPSYIQKWFIDYNEKHRGWTKEESMKMIKWHAVPFADAHEGAMIQKQRGILDYFTHRKSAQ